MLPQVPSSMTACTTLACQVAQELVSTPAQDQARTPPCLRVPPVHREDNSRTAVPAMSRLSRLNQIKQVSSANGVMPRGKCWELAEHKMMRSKIVFWHCLDKEL